jgi:hypothetical protein
MKSDDPKPPPPRWSTARLESLTGSQMKALLGVASGTRPPSAARPARTVAEDERLLADMNRALLDKALNESTAVEELIRIKDLAKVLIKEADGTRQREAARLLYHVAVAAAFVHHGARISGRSMLKQEVLYDRLAATWAEHPIGRLFSQAAARVAAPNPPE